MQGLRVAAEGPADFRRELSLVLQHAGANVVTLTSGAHVVVMSTESKEEAAATRVRRGDTVPAVRKTWVRRPWSPVFMRALQTSRQHPRSRVVGRSAS